MAKPIIEIEGLGKCYRIGTDREKYLSLRDELSKSAKGFSSRFLARHRHIPKDEEYWAIKDISFSVQQGQAVGIVGRNGAGKSTLLKILSKITPPTTGKITLRGRMASLLEVGTGFHPELTGRENIFLNGAILGMMRSEIRRKFDEIVAFAEVEKFLDTPVKRYSSGMYVRLAFAVAAHLEPEILIVDEVLAVGDAEFQKKCLGKMGEVTKAGRTVLFVTHQMAAVQSLCSHGVLLNSGRVEKCGMAAEVVERYLTNRGALSNVPLAERRDREGGQGGCLNGMTVNDLPAESGPMVYCGSKVTFRLQYQIREPVIAPFFSLSFWDNQGSQILYLTTRMAGCQLSTLSGSGAISCVVDKMPLVPGDYLLNVALWTDERCIDKVEGAATLHVSEGAFFGSADTSHFKYGKFLVEHRWSVEL